MTPLELYEATRGTWKLGERRKGARYAFALFEGVVREVYEIEAWHPRRRHAVRHARRDREHRQECLRHATSTLKLDRWELTGCPAAESIRSELGLPIGSRAIIVNEMHALLSLSYEESSSRGASA